MAGRGRSPLSCELKERIARGVRVVIKATTLCSEQLQLGENELFDEKILCDENLVFFQPLFLRGSHFGETIRLFHPERPIH